MVSETRIVLSRIPTRFAARDSLLLCKSVAASVVLKFAENLPKEIQMTQKQQWRHAMILGSFLTALGGGLGILGNYLLHAVFN
jgi:hypothetical protein